MTQQVPPLACEGERAIRGYLDYTRKTIPLYRMLLMCCLAYQSWTLDHPTSHLFPVMPLMFHAM